MTVEFIIMEQEDINLYCAVSDKLGVFLNSLHELENCVLHRYLPGKKPATRLQGPDMVFIWWNRCLNYTTG